MNIKNCIFGIVIFIFSTVAASQENMDPMCGAIVKFANSISAGNSQFIELTTDWGQENQIFCAYSSEIGKEFCAWLGSHASMEFQQVNISRALNCIGYPNVISLHTAVSIEQGTGQYSSKKALNLNPEGEITIKYSFGKNGELPKLKIGVSNKKGKA